MALFKVIFYFEGGASNWQEVYYRVGSNVKAAADLNQQAIDARCNCLHPFFSMRKYRVSDVNTSRSSVIVPVNRSGEYPTTDDSSPAEESAAIVINLVSTAVPCSRRLWMRGLAKESFTRDPLSGVDKIEPKMANRINAWIAQIASLSFAIYSKQRGVAGVVPQRVLSVDGTAGNGTSKVTLQTGILGGPGTFVTFSKVNQKELPSLNGKFAIVANDALNKQITINYSTTGNAVIFASTGQVALALYNENAVIDPAFSDWNFVGCRQTKNSGTGSRGARSAKRLRTLS